MNMQMKSAWKQYKFQMLNVHICRLIFHIDFWDKLTNLKWNKSLVLSFRCYENVILPDFYFKTGSWHVLHGILWAYLETDRKCLLVSRLLERVSLCALWRRRFCLDFRSRDDTRRFHETTFSLKRIFFSSITH